MKHRLFSLTISSLFFVEPKPSASVIYKSIRDKYRMMVRKNKLADEGSLYLQQHAYNPVDWHPWGDEALTKAKSNNKLLLVSIGYSSCHWCHVMERECFENEDVASVMNDSFVCIKVDREERPDIDNIYMTAVQLMSGSGGWPLNCIALPDGRPVWGGTYFKPERWVEIITGIARYYKNNPTETVKYAEELSRGVVGASLLPAAPTARFTLSDLKPAVGRLKDSFDPLFGGTAGAPKFPLPVYLNFLLHYGHALNDDDVLKHAELTLKKMSSGGIYDQAGGGFSRYSVDNEWRIPHFEKMLYDNAQMIGLYSDGFAKFGDERFRNVVYQSVDFIEREMMTTDELLCSSIDADSEGVEGRFYVWTDEEIAAIEVERRELFDRYYAIDQQRLWEGKYHVLTSPDSESEFCRAEAISMDELQDLKSLWREKLLEARDARERPATDTKVITAWNALAVTSLAKAYKAFGDDRFLRLAKGVTDAILSKQLTGEMRLSRIFSGGTSKEDGFLDDYAFLIQALISIYEVTSEERYLALAEDLLRYTTENFFDENGGLYLYSRKGSGVLITNHFELYDNVIPSSNYVMAHNLFLLGHILTDESYIDRAGLMLSKVADRVIKHPSGFSGWARILLFQSLPFYQFAVVGSNAEGYIKEVAAKYRPDSIIAGSKHPSDRPLFRDRYVDGKTLIYQCVDNSCGLPVESPGDLIQSA